MVEKDIITSVAVYQVWLEVIPVTMYSRPSNQMLFFQCQNPFVDIENITRRDQRKNAKITNKHSILPKYVYVN